MTKKTLTHREYIKQDYRMNYPSTFSKEWILDYTLKPEQFYLRQYIKLLRTEEYYSQIKPNKCFSYLAKHFKNKLGARIGFNIPAGCFGTNLKIWHYGHIFVHPNARIENGCDIHGNCCIDILSNDDQKAPHIGNNVNIGQSSQIIGSITIANNVVIGAGAIVSKNVLEENSVIVGQYC